MLAQTRGTDGIIIALVMVLHHNFDSYLLTQVIKFQRLVLGTTGQRASEFL